MGLSRTYLAVYLVSAATLTYEIGLMRLFSLAQGYHFAFMVISIALMGIGAGGAALMIFTPAGLPEAFFKDTRKTLSPLSPLSALSTLAALFSIAAVVSYATANLILFDPIKASWSKLEFLKILLQYLVLSLPFVFSGMIISAAIRSMSEKVHRIYFSDLAGAATGCVIILLVLAHTGGEGAVIAAAALGLAASLVFSTPSRARGVLLPAMALVLLLVVSFGPEGLLKVNISPYRDLSAALNFPGGRVIETLFSPSGRMDIVQSPAVRAAPGISLNYIKPLPPQIGFTINGGGLSTVTSRSGDLGFLTHLPSALAYRLKDSAEVFIIDPGGGMEVLSALANGASGVRGAETSGVVLEAMKGPLSGFSGALYNEHPIIHGYGRNVLQALDKRFDIIIIPRTGTLGSAGSGIRGLEEDFSLTAEAFGVYLDHLKEGGLVSVSMYLLPPPRQELKLLSTVIKALINQGVENPGDRLIAIRSWGVLTLLVKNGMVTEEEVKAVKTFSQDEGFDLVWYPGMKTEEANLHNRFEEPVYHDLFIRIISPDTPETREGFFAKYIFDVRPSIDDSPFFGQTFKMTRMRETYESVGRKWGVLIEGGYLLPWILVQAAVASVLLIMAPLLFIKRTKAPLGGLLYTCAYFAAIGAGFMFVEVALIQKLIPALGEPVYAVSTVLFSVLVSTGAGSYLSGRLEIFRKNQLNAVNAVLAVPVLVIVYLILIGPITGLIPKISTSALRFPVTFALLFPLGLSMGIPFPAGMSLLGKTRKELIPWAWCVNGSISVVSSVLVMMVALAWGFTLAFLLAACAYVGAWGALKGLSRRV
jgi:hypothetical protein